MKTKVVVGVDLGMSTGVAVVDTKGVVLLSHTITAAEHRSYLLRLQTVFDVEVVVLEEPLYGMSSEGMIMLQFRNEILLATTRTELVYVRPGQWKTSSAKGHYRDLPFSTPHEQDAAEIAYYWMLKNGKEDLWTYHTAE